MNWKTSLDRYLTTPPEDLFGTWCEITCDKFTEAFCLKNEAWIDEYSGKCNDWLNKLYNKGHEPQVAALIIERAFSLYIEDGI